ncbi:MAG TPA: 2'-5' RNA ligase family protein [Arachnia sp.]|nr:2'-5' RNA ligase family protein [Arachnia sp.]
MIHHDAGTESVTIACEDRDFAEWHNGRRHAAVWAFELDRPEVRDMLGQARRRLASLLLPRYERQPHVTVAFAGLIADDDFSDERLDADLALLRGLLDGPVILRATGWDSFPMVPYLRVAADWPHVAREALTRSRPLAAESYQPHVTVGMYDAVVPICEPVRLLDGLPFGGTWELTELSLLRFETADIAGPLEVVGRLSLSDGGFRHPAEAGVTSCWSTHRK